jgi:CRP-like cAMP-binding protein
MQIGTLWSTLTRLGTPRRVARGEFCFLEGDRATSVFVLDVGRIRLFTGNEDGRELTLAIVRPGEVFGEVAPAAEQRREASAQVTSPRALVREIRWGELLGHPKAVEITRHFLGQVSRRCAERDRQLLAMATLDVAARVERTLAELLRLDGTLLDITHQDIACLVGSSREHVTRALNALAVRGILLLSPKRIQVLRPDLLGGAAALPGGA